MRASARRQPLSRWCGWRSSRASPALLLGGWQTLDGQLAVGLYSVLVFMTQRLLWPLTDVAWWSLDLYQLDGHRRRIQDLSRSITVSAGARFAARARSPDASGLRDVRAALCRW